MTSPKPMALVVCDTWASGRGYQENAWLSTLDWLGWSARAVHATAGRSSDSANADDGISPIAVPVRRSMRSVLPDHRVTPAVVPDLILAFGNTTFAEAVVADVAGTKTRVISFFQVHESAEPGALGHLRRLLRPTWYRMAHRDAAVHLMDRSTDVIFSTPSTFTFFNKVQIPARQIDRASLVSLGVAPGTFTYNPTAASMVRQSLGIPRTATVLIASGRYHRRKRVAVKKLSGMISSLVSERPDVHAIVVGLPYMDQPHARVHLIPQLPQPDLANHLCAADCAVFMQPSIGIQQALACGLDVIAPVDDAVSHLTGCGAFRMSDGIMRDLRMIHQIPEEDRFGRGEESAVSCLHHASQLRLDVPGQ